MNHHKATPPSSTPPSSTATTGIRARAPRFAIAFVVALGLLILAVYLLRDSPSSAPGEPTPGAVDFRASGSRAPEPPSQPPPAPDAARVNARVGDSQPAATSEGGASSSEPPARYIVAGQVTDSQGTPLANATVRLVQGTTLDALDAPAPVVSGAPVVPGVSTEGTEPGTEPGSGSAQTVTCDASGHFTASVAIPGPCVLHTQADRHIARSVEWDVASTAGALTDDGDAREDGEALDTRSAAPGAPALVVVLLRECALAGVVGAPETCTGPCTIAVQRVTDPTTWHTPKIIEVPHDRRDFYVPVDPGRYNVWAYTPGTVRSAPLAAQPDQDRPVTDLRFDLIEGCSLEAWASEARTGRPVASAIVYAPRSHLAGAVDTLRRTKVDARFPNAGRTEADGRVTLADLPAGKLMIRFLHPDYCPLDTEVTLVAGEITRVEATLAEGPGIRGEVLDQQGAPWIDANVLAVAMSESFDRDAAQYGFAKVEPDGHYHIRHLNPGSYVVIRQAPGTEPPRMVFTQVPARDDAIVDFVEIAELATVRGQVIDPRGQPVAHAHLTFISGGADEDVGFKATQADAEGRFELRNLAVGRYEIGVSKRTGGNFAIADTVIITAATDYEREVTFPDLEIAGRVTGAGDQPIQGAELLLVVQPLDPQASPEEWRFAGRAESDASGGFRLEGLAEARYLLLGSAPGYRQTTREGIEVRATPSPTAVQLELQPGATVEVTVQDQTGAMVDGARVVILDAKGAAVNVGLPPLTRAGRYRYSSLTPGPHRIQVPQATGAPVEVEFNATLEAPAQVTVKVVQ